MEFHEYANLFPLLNDEELKELAADIREHGLINPIITYEDKILDGRNRYRACELAEVDPTFEEYHGGDPLSHVVSLNLTRRHLDTPQRAAVGNRLAALRDGQRKDRVASGIPLATQEEAAGMLNVSIDSVKQARKIERDGVPELSESLMKGGISLASAVEITKLPQEEQRAVVAAGPEAVKAKAKEIREAKTITPSPAPLETGARITYKPEESLDILVIIKAQIKRIQKEDVHRVKVLNEIIQICEDRINNNK